MQPPPAPGAAGPSSAPFEPFPPGPYLTSEKNVSEWPSTIGFQGFWGWIRRRCERIKGKKILRGEYLQSSKPIRIWMDLLEGMISWIQEVPPDPQAAQRFGNLAFRRYIALVNKRIQKHFTDHHLPPVLLGQLLPLLIESTAFGQPTRLDYGSGHELAFVLGLWCCVASGWIGGEGEVEEVEDELILRVFARYLDLVTLLQTTYRLEPAGSHGVWGLDDYCFLPYLFGSAQLLDGDISPSGALHNALATSRANRDSDRDDHAAQEINDFYTLSLYRITLFKSGASFSEHSPMLFSLSQMPNWVKPHHGLRKMFLGEVVGKRVVVQGLWIGGWCWGEKPPELQDKRRLGQGGSESGTGGGEQSRGGVRQEVITRAPWAR